MFAGSTGGACAVLAVLVSLLGAGRGAVPPGLRTTIIVIEGEVDVRTAFDRRVLGEGEGAIAGPDGRLYILGGMGVPPEGRSMVTEIIPIEGTIWVRGRGESDERDIRPGEVARIGPSGMTEMLLLDEDLLRSILDALYATAPPGESWHRFVIPVPPGRWRALGLERGDTIPVYGISEEEERGVSEEYGGLEVVLLAETVPAEISPAAETAPPETLAETFALPACEEDEIRDLFARAEIYAEAINIDGVLSLTTSPGMIEGRPMTEYADILRPKVSDATDVDIVYYIVSIDCVTPTRANVSCVGSGTTSTVLLDVGTFTASGSFDIVVTKAGGEWRFGEVDMRAFTIESSIIGLDFFGISLR